MNREELVLTSFSDLVNKLVLLNKHTMEERLGGYTSSEVHAVEYLAKHDDCNVTRLADAFCMTRSALSKVTKKLMEKGLVETYRKPDNKKEVYVALTAKGRDVAAVHDAAHEAKRCSSSSATRSSNACSRSPMPTATISRPSCARSTTEPPPRSARAAPNLPKSPTARHPVSLPK